MKSAELSENGVLLAVARHEEISALLVPGRSLVHRVLLAHPRSVSESYGAHLTEAVRIAAQLIGAGVACLVHGFLPILYERRASQTVASLHQSFAKRGLVQDNNSSEPEC